MTRTPAALVLALSLGLFQIGAARPDAAQQAGDAGQGAAAPDAGTQPAEPDGQGDAPQATFRADVNFVRVDVIVTDGNEPVTDLTEADFEILEDGRPQAIEQFRLIRVDGNPAPGTQPPGPIRTTSDEERELARDDVRLFVFFFDDYHVRLGNSLGMREPLMRFVREQLRPNDVVGLMYPLTPLDSISFTRNQESLLTAMRNFEGRKFDYQPRNLYEEQYVRYPTEIVEQIRNQVVMTALRGLSTKLGGLREGRKAVIYVSEGLTAMLPPQMRNRDALLGGLDNPSARDPFAGESSQREETAAFFAQSDLYSQMQDVFREANRNNVAIYALDPRGLATFEFDINETVGPNQDARTLQMTQDTLRVLADETDGRAIVNRNDLLPGLAQIVRDSSFYYLIGYNSSEAPTDGKFHEISVRVRRSGVDVRARKGYWAVTPEDIIRAETPTPETSKPIQQALASIAPSVRAAKYVRTWLGTERGDDGKTRMTLVWEALPAQTGIRGGQPQPGRVALIAATEAGDLVYRGNSEDAALVFDAPPGSLELRMTVEAANNGGTLDSEIRTVVVPDLTSPDAAISTPRVYRARTAIEFRTLAADAAATPVAAREFSRTERLLIRFDVYGNATPTAILMNRNGDKMADLPVAAAAAGGTHQIDLGLAAVAPGEYLVEITAAGATGEVSELVPLRIGS